MELKLALPPTRFRLGSCLDLKSRRMHQGVKVLLVLMCVTAGGFVIIRGLTPGFPDLPNILPTQKQVIKEPVKEPPCTCEKCLSEEEQWISNRWDKSVEPFLSAQYKLPLNDYNWWRGLQLDKHGYDYYSQLVEGLFKLFPPDPDVVKASPDLCRTCAVVGNSGNLKGSRYGPLIDFHDVIIRINHGRTNGYEADVGRRTTHRIMYPESASDLDNSTHLLLFPFKTMDLDWLQKAFTTGFSGRSYAPIRSRVRANKDLVMVLNPGFMKYVHEKWLDKKGSYSSTGFMALILALHICDEVHVFGFGADKDGNWSHYWEDLKNKRFGTGIHPGKHEYEAIIRLARAIKIKLYKGR